MSIAQYSRIIIASLAMLEPVNALAQQEKDGISADPGEAATADSVLPTTLMVDVYQLVGQSLDANQVQDLDDLSRRLGAADYQLATR